MSGGSQVPELCQEQSGMILEHRDVVLRFFCPALWHCLSKPIKSTENRFAATKISGAQSACRAASSEYKLPSSQRYQPWCTSHRSAHWLEYDVRDNIPHGGTRMCDQKTARMGPELPNCRPKMSVSDSQSATVSEHALAAAPHWAACTASALPASGSAQMDVL